MRIVSGNFRGKKLFPPSHNIRPTLDKVKQAFFTRMQFEIVNSVFLDLFSGSGAVGIEAVSRDAKKVVFCDNNKDSIALTKKNIYSLDKKNISTQIEVMFCSYENCLKKLNDKFDIIYIDPPYASGYYENAIKLILENELLAESGTIICERLKNDKPVLNENLQLECTKNYGSVSLDYFKIKQ